ncbi:MAG: putative glycine rich protein [Solirubrobacterales bacterium]|nr:putative glycine rich protein [Solirubrobacterales bacterium]
MAASSPDLRRRHPRRVGTALAALCVVASTLAWAAPAQATTQTFTFNGAEQTFTVPGGVHNVGVVAIGASGGERGGVLGGAGAEVIGTINVVPGQTLYIEVGNNGKSDGSGGSNGGGAGGTSGGAGGGGASDIRTSPESAGLSPEDRLIVAAGGGGAGGTGEASLGGAGGMAGSAGAEAPASGNTGGGAGTELAGGAGGSGCGGTGSEGVLGSGGEGSAGAGTENGGGGGGGGFFGGGGGSGGCSFGGGGGGGGSSLVPAGGLELTAVSGAEVKITYTLVPPSIAIVSPANGATYTKGQAVTALYSCTPPEGTTVASCKGSVANGSLLDTSALGPRAFTVEAEDSDGATASKVATYTIVAAPVLPAVVPDAILGSHPKAKLKVKKKAKASFSFSSSTAGATFECKLDKGAFAPCTSPKSYKVKPGKHTFSVEAVSAAGADPTPATFSFKVTKKKKKH